MAMPLLWPNLGLTIANGVEGAPLDYVVMQYSASNLQQAAKTLEDIGTPVPRSVASLLRELADSDAALTALNHCRKQAPAALRNLNITTHLAAVMELMVGRDKEALGTVATAWNIEPNTVRDCDTEHREMAARCLEHLIGLYLSRPGTAQDRNHALWLIDCDMHCRAGYDWFAVRKKAA